MTAVAGVQTLEQDLAGVRQRTLDLVAHLEDAEFERQVHPVLSPLAWDLAHIAAYEDLWLVHRHAGRPLLRPDLAATYDAFETPRAVRGEVELLDAEGAREYLAAVRERTLEALEDVGPDPVLHEMVLRHELQHTETMLQAMRLAGLLAPGTGTLAAVEGPDAWIEVAAGTHLLGAPDDGRFAYDNERPAREIRLEAFRIARRPVTNASWLRFTEGGGYVRREWWSDETWAWKEQYDISCPAGVADGEPDAPVCHVSAFEADAFARWAGARLPIEAEWECAQPLLAGVGLVWEWTSSAFRPYPGFRPFPYPEYSQVFFGDRHRVLRGGSWVAHPRVATRTFRNWDLPERRQIFAGLRLAHDAEEC
ncbi:MAG TPA: SUMF1/EgtB/PvdO family nonheme iron enzyme [Baekduia sp.]|nr:SUMF1/EgtB/PvdO family nonheme iron enzyme [Baekduia sp.]